MQFFLLKISKKKEFCKKSENPLLPYAEDCNLCKYSLFEGQNYFCNLKVSKLSRQRYIGPSFGMQQCRENSRLPHKAHFSWQSICCFFGAFEMMASHGDNHTGQHDTLTTCLTSQKKMWSVHFVALVNVFPFINNPIRARSRVGSLFEQLAVLTVIIQLSL